jgi:CheY-like chemotaxis protein
LKQVIVNLLSNAVKYSSAGGIVEVKVSSNEDRTLRISVHDTGEGLPPEKLSQLFQPFKRLGQEGSTTEGTGIGLVVTKRLTELMGGKVGVQSTVGVGSIFWIELSAAHELPVTEVTQTDVAVRSNQILAYGAASTILYVEDNIANFELVEQILADRSQLRLLRAQDGTQGINMARNHRPDVILMDINLPGISGVEVLKVLRQDPATRHIPVLAISANAMPADIMEGLAAGFFRYLTKPFKVNEFLEVLDLALVAALNKSVSVQE